MVRLPPRRRQRPWSPSPAWRVRVSTAWHLHPLFLDALARRVQEALARFPAGERERVPVILTAHSLPRPVVDREPNYVERLQERCGP